MICSIQQRKRAASGWIKVSRPPAKHGQWQLRGFPRILHRTRPADVYHSALFFPSHPISFRKPRPPAVLSFSRLHRLSLARLLPTRDTNGELITTLYIDRQVRPVKFLVGFIHFSHLVFLSQYLQLPSPCASSDIIKLTSQLSHLSTSLQTLCTYIHIHNHHVSLSVVLTCLFLLLLFLSDSALSFGEPFFEFARGFPLFPSVTPFLCTLFVGSFCLSISTQSPGLHLSNIWLSESYTWRADDGERRKREIQIQRIS